MEPLRIILVEDHEIVREGLCTLLEASGELQVVGQASTARDGLKLAADSGCQVVVSDLGLPGEDGLWLIAQLRQQHPEVPVLVLSMYVDDQIVVEALEAGASGYMPKGCSCQELAHAIREVWAGRIYVHASVAQAVLTKLRARGEMSRGRETMTARETEILELLAGGMGGMAIANRLELSQSTVKTHLRTIYRKLNVADREGAVAVARQRGLIGASS